MPNVNFQRMTASAVGPGWRQATPEQRKRLQEEFKTLSVRTTTPAPWRRSATRPSWSEPIGAAADGQGSGGALPRVEEARRRSSARRPAGENPGEGAGWKICNLNVLGVWLVETYRSQFAQEINAKGLNGLITTLTERNKADAKG